LPNPARHCEAHIKILKIKKNPSCRGNPDSYRDLNWNTMSGFLREVEATTTVSASNSFSGDCHIAGSFFNSMFLLAIRNDVS
jgi:hypothetical protein